MGWERVTVMEMAMGCNMTRHECKECKQAVEGSSVCHSCCKDVEQPVTVTEVLVLLVMHSIGERHMRLYEAASWHQS
jgi:hypothetical protein